MTIDLIDYLVVSIDRRVADAIVLVVDFLDGEQLYYIQLLVVFEDFLV